MNYRSPSHHHSKQPNSDSKEVPLLNYRVMAVKLLMARKVPMLSILQQSLLNFFPPQRPLTP